MSVFSSNESLQLHQNISCTYPSYAGKSTLAKILLRLADYHSGQILINDRDLRQYNPIDFHTHVTAVLQGFSKFDSSLKENVGVGYLPEARSDGAVEKAVELAGAEHMLHSLPNGVKTILDSMSGQSSAPSSPNFREEFGHIGCPKHQQYGLSGGEVCTPSHVIQPAFYSPPSVCS